MGWFLVLVLMFTSTFALKDNATNLQLSVLTAPEHAPFDGTVYPIEKVPDWLGTNESEREGLYRDLPESKLMPIPSYDPSRMRVDTASLDWGDDYDDYTRQMKITYPVLYAGTYQFDHIEGIGSHPGVDIKAPQGTPLHSIANGVVEKVVYSNSGFGNHIVIRHSDVPTLEDESARTTLHSGYAHMDEIFVTDGQVLDKGDVIGTVGNTGISTNDHLHFQIDTSEAPWSLYWPFTSSEASQVGGFWSAVNQGLNIENIYGNTVHPMNYVEKYLDAEATYSAAPESVPEIVEEEEEPELEEEIEEVEAEEESEEEVDEEDSGLPFEDVRIVYEPSVFLKQKQVMEVSIVDERGELVRNASFNAPIEIRVGDPTVARFFPMEIDSRSISNGIVSVEIEAAKVGSTEFTVHAFNEQKASGEIVVPADRKPLDSFSIETDHNFYIGQPETVLIAALTEDNERLSQFDLRSPLRLVVVEGDGFFSRSALTEDDFELGLASVQFTATSDDDVVLRVENDDYDGSSALLASNLFSDVEANHPYYQAISYLKSQGVIQGYDDNTFKPEREVSRAEAVKLIYAGLSREISDSGSLDFPDVESGAWYVPYLITAKNDGVIKGYADGTFKPGNTVNRVELLKMLTSAAGIDLDPVVVGDPYNDVHYLEWYAPLAQWVTETRVDPWNENKLNPGNAITRGDVAEILFRVLAIQRNEVPEYSRTLVMG